MARASRLDTKTSRGRWFQSKFVLSTARKIYLFIAVISLLTIIFGLVAVAILEIPDLRSPPKAEIGPVTVNTEAVAKSLQPPGNVRFIAAPPEINQPLAFGEAVGYFDADTQNGLAPFPNDFDILGGKDAALFDRIPVDVRFPDRTVRRAGLRPNSALLDEINKTLASSIQGKRQTFTLRVIARDRFGAISPPQDISFTLTYGYASEQASPESQMTELQKLARDIALLVDPEKSPAYFDAYNQAMKEPSVCGASVDNLDFVLGYANAFAELKPQLRNSNIESFYAGVCIAWGQGVASVNAERSALAAKRTDLAAQKITAKVIQGIVLYVVGGAVSTFLMISLFLAFLAMENHAEALRQVAQRLADQSQS